MATKKKAAKKTDVRGLLARRSKAEARMKAGTVMQLTKDEASVVEAMRAKRGTFRPDVIAGFKTPTNAGELREMVRLMLDCCTPIMATSQGECEIDIAYEDGADASIVISDEALGIEAASTLYRPVEKYRRPTNPAELKQLIRSFLEAEFGMTAGGLADSSGLEIDLNVEGGCDLVRLEAGRPEEFEDEATEEHAEKPAFRPVAKYNIPSTRREFAESLVAFAQVDLGLTLECFVEEESPVPHFDIAFTGLGSKAEVDGICLAMPVGGYGLPRVVVGPEEEELLDLFRKDKESRGLDPSSETHGSWTPSLLSEDEVGVLDAYRSGKGPAAEARSPMGRMLAAALELHRTVKISSNEMTCVEAILHEIVLLANGRRTDDIPAGTLAVRHGTTMVLIDSEDACGNLKTVHVVDDGDVSNLGDEPAEESEKFLQPASN